MTISITTARTKGALSKKVVGIVLSFTYEDISLKTYNYFATTVIALKPSMANVHIKMSRVWSKPNRNTFNVPPIRALVRKHLSHSTASVDPFARNKRWATYTNDLNPDTAAEHHMDALDFLLMLRDKGIKADLVIFDPPYSPRQVKECYDGIGLKMKQEDAWRTAAWTKERDVINDILKPEGIVLSFGWNTHGMSKARGYEIEEILLICHGAASNDTICTVERKIASAQMPLISEAA